MFSGDQQESGQQRFWWRQLGLELAAVLHSWWAGQLDTALDQNLVQELVRAGLVTVDTAQPSLAPEQPDTQPGPEQREAAARLSDHELVTRDVVAGLVRMKVVARCDYLLRVERYSDPALVTAVLAVITRLYINSGAHH